MRLANGRRWHRTGSGARDRPKIVVAEDDIGAVTVAIGDVEGLDGGPKRDDGEFETVGAAQPDPFDEPTVRQVAEDLARNV